MTVKQAVVAGLICLDVKTDLSALPEGQFQRLFQPGRLVHTRGVQFTPGGAVSNTGLALHRLGVPVRLIGKIGADLFGETLQNLFRAEADDLADDLVIDLTLPTSFTIIINPPGTDRLFLHNPGANDTFYASDLPRAILEDADLFHFGYPSVMRSIYRGEGGELVSILQRARRAGLTTSLDFTLPDPTSPAGSVDWPAVLANTLPLVDLFVPSVEELVFLLDRASFDRMSADANTPIAEAVEPDLLDSLADTVLGYGVKALLVKLGQRGIYLRTATGEVWQKGGRGLDGLDDRWHNRALWAPAYRVVPHGTTGAGDAAIAGFLASILQGATPETALKMAVAAGAACVETETAITGLTDWDALWARIQRGWDTHPVDLRSHGWGWVEGQGLWEKSA